MGTLEDAHNFMRRKREKYIQRWEKTYNKIYNDKKRTVLTNDHSEGRQRLMNEAGEEVNVGHIDFTSMLERAL